MINSIAIRVAAAVSGMALCGVAAAQQILPLTSRALDPPPGAANLWPWIAVGGILAVLGVISLGARRLAPFRVRSR